LVFRVTFLRSEQLWAKFKIFISCQCPEFNGEITFFATKVGNVKNGGLKIENVKYLNVRWKELKWSKKHIKTKSSDIFGPSEVRATSGQQLGGHYFR
jgi:hypothetical protein